MRTIALAVVLGLAGSLAGPGAATASPTGREALLDRLAADPADSGALLGMASIHERAGRRRHARRYLRAFVRLVYRHPDRPEAARRLAALRPSHPFVLERDDRKEGGFLIYRNLIDRALAVRVPAGPYRRRLEFDDATVWVNVTLPDYFIDLHEATIASWDRFLWEGAYEVPAYWSADGMAWRRATNSPHRNDWRWLGGRSANPQHPQWGDTYFEARARARWAGKRIPTEAEWEKAARGGLHLDGEDGRRKNPFPERRFPWGDAPPIAPDGTYRANLGGAIALDDSRDEDGTIPIDTLPEGAGPYGCRHMAGNVTEWNSDDWADDAARFRLPRTSPCTDGPTDGRYDGDVRTVRGGYFNTGWRSARIDERDRRTFGDQGMCYLFKAGLRCAADAPQLPDNEKPDVGPLTDEPDPLDVDRLHVAAQEAEAAGDLARAYRFARAALRLVRHGVLRARLIDDVSRLRPADPWVDLGGGRWRNDIDGKIAVESAGVRADVYEVTEGDWMRFAAEGGYEVREHWTDEGWRNRSGAFAVNIARVGRGDLPLTFVSLHEARAYARWAHKRLPTIEEWNRLAGRSERRYPWGDEPPGPESPRCACDETTAGEDEGPWPDRRMPVGSFPAGRTPDGLHDLLGNVMEWVEGSPDPESPWDDVLLGGDVWTARADLGALEPRIEAPDECGPDSGRSFGLRCVADRAEDTAPPR